MMSNFVSTDRKKSIFHRFSVASLGVLMKGKPNRNNLADVDFNDIRKDILNAKPQSLEELESKTKFNRRELKIMYRAFKQECPNGLMTEEKFFQIYQPFFPQGNSQMYAGHIFRAMQLRSDGEMTFDKIVKELSVISHGELADQIQWAFDIYDVHNRGCVSRQDFVDVVYSIYQLLGDYVYPSVTRAGIIQHANSIFEDLDKDGHGELTVDDFKSAFVKNQQFICNMKTLATIL